MVRSALVIAAVLGTFLTQAAVASPLSFSASLGGTPNGSTRVNFDGADPYHSGALTVSFQPDAAFVTGSLSGVYAAPFLSGSNGNGFGAGGSNQANGADATTYITTGSTGANSGASATFSFSSAQAYFGLLWGSVDSYNTLTFYNGNTVVGTLTGAQVTASPTGDQGASGSLYVNINSSQAFDRVVATSSSYAFEIDNVAFAATNLPEPASMALLGMGLLGAAALRRKRA